jgi:hypothetical protein
MQRRIARNDCATKLPLGRMLHQLSANWIRQNIMTNTSESVAPPILVLQHVIVRLMLKLHRSKLRLKIRAQKSHAVALIAVSPKPHPDEVNMIRHQAIGGAEHSLARNGVQHQFSKCLVKRFVQPALASSRHRQRPVNDCISLIILSRQAREMKPPFSPLSRKSIRFTFSKIRHCGRESIRTNSLIPASDHTRRSKAS